MRSLASKINYLLLLGIVALTSITSFVYFEARYPAHQWIPSTNMRIPFKTAYAPLPAALDAHFTSPDPERQYYHEWNDQTLRELYACILLDNCGTNQKKVALLASHWFEEAIVRGWRGGEGIWGMSVYKNLRELGYTTLFANTFDEALAQYRMMPDLVKVVVRDRPRDCQNDRKCVKNPENPSGIPTWKIFDFEFFPSYGAHRGANMLGGKWILAANPDHRVPPGAPSPIQYIGYSIQDVCSQVPIVPLAERKNQAWMLMKQLTYVYNDNFSWNHSYFSRAAEEMDIDFVGGWKISQTYQWDPKEKGIMTDIADPEHRVTNLGALSALEFAAEVGNSKVMVGVGSPWWSPSPYNALCQGVPFLNPVMRWDKKDPWDRSRWYTQHPSLTHVDPPWVYHVHAHNYTGFVDAVRTASETEIGRYIPEYMTEESIQERLVGLMETDWRAKAEVLLEENIAKGGDAYVCPDE